MPELMEGRAAVVAVWRQWMEVLDEWRIEIHEIVDADPWVVSDVQWFAKGKGSEVTIDWRVTEAHRFRDGKIACSIFGYPDVAAARSDRVVGARCSRRLLNLRDTSRAMSRKSSKHSALNTRR